MKIQVFVGLGSNLGLRESYIEKAIDALASIPSVALIQVASVYETEPVGVEDQPPFLNTVIELQTEEHPKRLLHILKQIEGDLGRHGDGQVALRWGPREIDLDLLLYGDKVISDAELQIPHSEMHKRRFVLEPLAEIAGQVLHPVLGKSIAELLQDLPDEKGVELFLPRDRRSRQKTHLVQRGDEEDHRRKLAARSL